MFDLSMERALTLADEFFPHAPEKIVQQYGIDVRRSRLNCDGWCLQLEGRASIRINNDALPLVSDLRWHTNFAT
jgi:hypothetical protein